MTRFARAKGSKSSNERVPDEATPWNVMKMQLEDNQTPSNVTKPKSAKQLLTEKDEPFYCNTTGNINHEWATFDDVPEKQPTPKEKINKLQKNQSSNNDKKKIKKAAKLHLLNGDAGNEKIPEATLQTNNTEATLTAINKLQSKKSQKKKKSIANAGKTQIGSEEVFAHENKDMANANDASSNLSAKDSVANTESNFKNKNISKKTKNLSKQSKKQKLSTVCEPTENVALDTRQTQACEAAATEDSADNKLVASNVEENPAKLSKRQKRNQKKQRKIIDEKNEHASKIVNQDTVKDKVFKGFDVEGNDWDNEVRFEKKTKPLQASATTSTESDNVIDKNKNLDKRKKKLNKKDKPSKDVNDRDKNTVSEDSKPQQENGSQNQKGQKRKGGKNDNKEYKRRKPDEGAINMMINGTEVLVVKYDGFPVKKEDADRLQELKKTMIIKGIPRSEINVAMKLERRKAEKALTRERKRVCFHCRKSGHNLSDCPELGRDEAGTGICFKCGSTEHTHFECKVVKGPEFRHASCFICREQGHIARQCPDNPKGLYPQGGGCKLCGDVTHLKKDCPDLMKEKEETNITVDKIVGSHLESLEDRVDTKNEIVDTQTRKRIVKF